MNFNHLLLTSFPQKNLLLEYGFQKEGNLLVLNRKLDEEFYAVFTFDFQNLTAEVFENQTGEKYALLDVKTAHGEFVSSIREKVSIMIEEIIQKCSENRDLKSEYIDFLEKELSTKGEYPWENESSYSVYRCENQKWFALVMKIKFKNLGFESEEPVWVVNLKADAEKIPELVDGKSIFPAWHMNKKYWITVLLTSVTDFDTLKKLTLRSKELVEKK